MIGQTIGDYRILEKRGEGGMGMFFKAQDIRLERLVGLKTIRAELLHEPEILAKLEEEAKSLARLDHPNIARLHHYMVIEEQRYIVMEYVEGSDLSVRMRRDGPLPLDLMLHLVPQICAAIGYAHQRGVIHRDIKPSNILVTGDNTAKVTDFGIAKILGVSSKTKTGVATGSLPYMAPEQIRGTGVDARTDIYQLGVMFFELLVGRRPFLAETEYDMMSHHLSTPPPTPSSIDSAIPKSIDQVLLKALAKDPAARFASATDLANAFKAATTADDISRTVYRVEDRHSPTSHTTARPRRGPFWRIGAIAIGLLAILAFVKVFLLENKDVPRTVEPLVEVSISAILPEGIQPISSASQRFLIKYQSPGMRRRIYLGERRDLDPPVFDSLSLGSTRTIGPGAEFSLVLWLTAGDSVQFSLLFTGGDGAPIITGSKTAFIAEGGPLQVRIPMTASPPKLAVAPEPVNAPATPHVTPTDERRNEPAEAPDTGSADKLAENLTLDVQPFTERDKVESIWIDGKKQSSKFPLALRASPGRRTVRWQIGADIWTDTVTVGNTPVEKHLVFEMSRGRVNVAVTFPDGPGYAEILLDGQQTGQGTPGELRNVAAGPHEITLRRDGYQMRGGPYIVRVPANDRARVNITMTPR